MVIKTEEAWTQKQIRMVSYEEPKPGFWNKFHGIKTITLAIEEMLPSGKIVELLRESKDITPKMGSELGI